jgi:membrane protein YdbS with pleckstrin-like domain
MSRQGSRHMEEDQVPMPRMITDHRNHRRHDEFDDRPTNEKYLSWVWPISYWLAIIANACICAIAIMGMWSNGYLWYVHASIFINFCATIAALAFIYRYILGMTPNVRPDN